MAGKQINAGPPGGEANASGWVGVGEDSRVINAGATFDTDSVAPLRPCGYPHISFYVLVTLDPAAAGVTIQEQFSFTKLALGGFSWRNVNANYPGALTIARLNGATVDHGQPLYMPCLACRMRITAGAGGNVTITWYIAAGM